MPRGHSGAWPFAIGAPCVVGEAADVETPGPATVGDAAPGGAVFGGGPGSPDEPRRAPQCVQKRACGLVGAPQWPQNLATAIDIVKERASLCRAGRHSGLYKQEANVQGHSLPLQQRTAKTLGPHTYSPKYNARPYTVFTSPAVGAGSVNCRTGSAGGGTRPPGPPPGGGPTPALPAMLPATRRADYLQSAVGGYALPLHGLYYRRARFTIPLGRDEPPVGRPRTAMPRRICGAFRRRVDSLVARLASDHRGAVGASHRRRVG